jgi:hypothetical protein
MNECVESFRTLFAMYFLSICISIMGFVMTFWTSFFEFLKLMIAPRAWLMEYPNQLI